MTESLPAVEKENQDQPRKRGSGLAFLAMLLAIVSLCFSGWLWWGTHQSRGEEIQYAADLGRQGQLLAELDARSKSLGSKLSALASADRDQRLDRLEAELSPIQAATEQSKSFQEETSAWRRSMQALLENTQAQLAGTDARLAALSARNMDSSAELDLDEVDYLLRMAQERLALFADVRMADRALEIADQHIAAFDNPIYIGVRRELSSARQALSQLNLPDYLELNQNLDSLQNTVVSLPFKGEQVSSGQPGVSGEIGWWARIRNAFSGLVTVRRSTSDEEAFPVLADQEMIKQRAWLELEVARLAALRRDQLAYAAALSRFSSTLSRWFEPSGQGWRNAMAVLQQLEQVDIDPPMPDLSAPWTALHALRESGISAPLPNKSEAPAEGRPGKASDSQAEGEQQSEEMGAGDDTR